MRAKRVWVVGFVSLSSLCLLAGCTTAAKQVYHEWRGAQAKLYFVQELPEDALERYQSVQFERPTSSVVPRICPPSLLEAYFEGCRRIQAGLRDEYPGGEPTLRVSSDIEFFQPKGLLGTAMCLSRVQMRDQEQLVVDAVLVAESEAFRQSGAADLANASAKALGKFLRARKEVKEDEEDHDQSDKDRKKREKEEKRKAREERKQREKEEKAQRKAEKEAQKAAETDTERDTEKN